MTSAALFKVAFVSAFAIQCILWSQSRFAHVNPRLGYDRSPRSLRERNGDLTKFSNISMVASLWLMAPEEDECAPLSVPLPEQCPHVREFCPAEETVLSIPYTQKYFCSPPAARPAVFAGLVVWLIFLFSTLGISASDFFCPNLTTIAHVLGLDENVAGVTFLAFGNGSPDLFSTFSAMKADSGSLAIGELLGAASFIVSVVVGSMCIIKPFHVNRMHFLRDVGFFTLAITLLLIILFDGLIKAWEAGILVLLYLVYVAVVVVGTWWEKKQAHKRHIEELARNEYEPEPVEPYFDEEPYRDNPSAENSFLLPSPGPRLGRSHSNPPVPSTRIVDRPQLRLSMNLPHSPRHRSRASSISSSSHNLPSFSLLGALEFRSVVNSLHQQSNTAALEVFESPITPFAAGHYHFQSSTSGRTPRPRSTSDYDQERDPFDDSLGLALDERHRQEVDAEGRHLLPHGNRRSPIPSISIQSPDSAPSSSLPSPTLVVAPTPLTRQQRFARIVSKTFHLLFPTLHGFTSKSWAGMVASLFAAPAVLALTLTLPVVVTTPNDGSSAVEKLNSPQEERLVEFEEEGVERVLVAEDEVEEELHDLEFNKYLTAAQCVLGALFTSTVLFGHLKHSAMYLMAAGIAGISMATLVLVFADKGNDSAARIARCFMGFFVAVIWIMAIADEVVQVLQTFGLIFGLSDAIIGLTIFAVGNSLADCVANITVAAFAPIMGFSACFGGPMLNILLGVGLSGSYIIHETGKSYQLHFSTTLLVSGIGLLALLLATMIVVPLNGFLLSRRWGVLLIVSYIVIMIINIVVEIRH